jgi:hypothetical protein
MLRRRYIRGKGGKPPTVSEDGVEDSSNDWKVWERVMRSSGKPSDWISKSKQPDLPSGCKESKTGPCGKVDLL